MQLIEITKENNEQYQAFVQTKGIFLQDFEWGDFQSTLGKKVWRFAVLDSAGKISATAQFLENGKYIFAPYGPILVEPDSRLLHFFLKQIQQRFPELVFFRVEPRTGSELLQGENFKPENLRPSINLNPHKTLVLDLTQNEQQLLSEMHPKTRYNIKVAQRSGIEIKMHDSAQDLLQPIFETGARAGIRSHSADYYLRLVQHFSAAEGAIRSKVFTAWHENDLLATNIVIFYQDACTYLFGGSTSTKRNLMAPYLLHWQTIQKAKEEQYKKYDFWGVEEDKNHAWAGISRFKFGFGGKILHYPGTFDFIAKDAWYNIYRALRTLNRIFR